MSVTEILVRLLADGEFHSGEEVGRQLGVSRTAVWKQLKKLADYGLQLESVKGRGYRLAQPLELLDQALLQEELMRRFNGSATLPTPMEPDRASRYLDVLFAIGSTNDYAPGQLDRGEATSGYLCLGEFQHHGRGRRGRHWVSPLGSNLILSLVLEFESGAAALEGLSLAVSIAVVRALKALGLQRVQLKWPNDLLVDERKLGGILLEMRGDPSGRCQVVIGVGLNVLMAGATAGIDQPWTTVADYLPEVSRHQVAVAVIGNLLDLLESYPDTGFAAFKEEWLSYDAFSGRQVVVSSGDQTRTGVAAGVTDNGALLLDSEGVTIPCYGGEISLRLHRDS